MRHGYFHLLVIVLAGSRSNCPKDFLRDLFGNPARKGRVKTALISRDLNQIKKNFVEVLRQRHHQSDIALLLELIDFIHVAVLNRKISAMVAQVHQGTKT